MATKSGTKDERSVRKEERNCGEEEERAEERGGSPCGSIDRSIDGVPFLSLSLSLSIASWLSKPMARRGEEEGQKEREKRGEKKRDESTSKRYRGWPTGTDGGGGKEEGAPRGALVAQLSHLPIGPSHVLICLLVNPASLSYRLFRSCLSWNPPSTTSSSFYSFNLALLLLLLLPPSLFLLGLPLPVLEIAPPIASTRVRSPRSLSRVKDACVIRLKLWPRSRGNLIQVMGLRNRSRKVWIWRVRKNRLRMSIEKLLLLLLLSIEVIR